MPTETLPRKWLTKTGETDKETSFITIYSPLVEFNAILDLKSIVLIFIFIYLQN
jgi:hypothetical protein